MCVITSRYLPVDKNGCWVPPFTHKLVQIMRGLHTLLYQKNIPHTVPINKVRSVVVVVVVGRGGVVVVGEGRGGACFILRLFV